MFLTCCRARPPPITQGFSASPSVKGVITNARGGCASVYALAAPVYRGRARVPHSEAPAVRWRSIERSETTDSAPTPGGLPPPSRVCGEGVGGFSLPPNGGGGALGLGPRIDLGGVEKHRCGVCSRS